MEMTIVTDIPVWVRPLKRALEAGGMPVRIVTEPEEVVSGGLVVNRISALIRERDREKGRRFEKTFGTWESAGKTVINGAKCFELGCSKLSQARLFEHCGVRTPKTLPAIPGSRALPGRPVLLKPAAGGFGKGIVKIGSDESAPVDLFEAEDEWIEQEIITAADQRVHRIEVLGPTLLYEARSPLRPDEYNYCLADPDSETVLVTADEVPSEIAEAALRVAREAGMEIGGLEYLAGTDEGPVFIDLNPVSSLHPGARELLGRDPVEVTADYLRRQAKEAG
jgi:glutathione synthase/RimK-type ligase-like ATP-grasp enzyme